MPRQIDDVGGVDAIVAHGLEVPLDEPAVPTLLTAADERAARTVPISLSASPILDRCLREQVLAERCCRDIAPLPPARRELVLAHRLGEPVWVSDPEGRHQRAVALPEELTSTEGLRERLTAGRFLALLPLLVLLRSLCRSAAWQPPPLQAAFIIDDPNLHGRSYGYVDLAKTAALAASQSFHVALATVPLDGWFASKRAIDVIRRHPRLSLLVHGNDHTRCELAKLSTEREAMALAAQALRRIGALERRTGLAISRVMAPPHGQCAPVALRVLPRLGFLGACISRPYPWLDRAPAEQLLAQWHPADCVERCPVLPRYSLTKPRDDIPLRAFLGQPLILYGHHEDLAGGPDLLADVAGYINKLGDVRWQSLSAIARSTVSARYENDLLTLRPFTREADVRVPRGASRLAVDATLGAASPTDAVQITSAAGALEDAAAGDTVALPEGVERCRLRLVASNAREVSRVPPPRPRIWPVVRRLTTEARDRLTPTVDALQTRRAPSRTARGAAFATTRRGG